MIRAFQHIDEKSLIEIMKLLTPDFFAPGELADFENYLKHEIQHYFVFLIQDAVVAGAGINYFNSKKEVRISWDLVHPNYIGKGIGSKLLKHRLNFIKNHFPDYTIIVRTSQMSFGFYESHQFVLQEIKKDFWAPGFDLYQMTYKESYKIP